MESIFLILLIVVLLGLPILSMRKQSKQIKEIKSFQAALEPGMIVQMTSGLHGRIDEVGPTTVSLELTPGVITTWDRNSVLKAVETPDTELQESTASTPTTGAESDNESTGDNDADGGQDHSQDYGSVPDSPEGIDRLDSNPGDDNSGDRPRD